METTCGCEVYKNQLTKHPQGNRKMLIQSLMVLVRSRKVTLDGTERNFFFFSKLYVMSPSFLVWKEGIKMRLSIQYIKKE